MPWLPAHAFIPGLKGFKIFKSQKRDLKLWYVLSDKTNSCLMIMNPVREEKGFQILGETERMEDLAVMDG